ncbi:hypothetical protein BC937DRAFT_86893 [Endogone sp. FLAS-F59071]|nr:hypothetical protein BC937DRAFT_86893 [Endogone sp. FLAS-F59071]|eukprot:RUS12836.1 hypothetical protein BC937DRAFT_86893 [Endogone sp. FLAS-F59071]
MATVHAYNPPEPSWHTRKHIRMDPIFTRRTLDYYQTHSPPSTDPPPAPATPMTIVSPDTPFPVQNKNQPRQSLPQPLPPSPTVSSPTTSPGGPAKETKPGPSQEITWLFFRDNQWVPFDNDNHYRIEQAFTLGGVYVDVKDRHFPDLKCVRVFPTRFYLSYLGMKYRISCVLQK